MATIERTGDAAWEGGKSGKGRLATGSGVLDGQAYSFGTRFRGESGTNPEELVASAHAGCYAMALAFTLEGAGFEPRRIGVHARCSLTPKGAGFVITAMHLDVTASVPDIDEDTFQELALKAESACVVSNALRGNLDIQFEAHLTR